MQYELEQKQVSRSIGSFVINGVKVQAISFDTLPCTEEESEEILQQLHNLKDISIQMSELINNQQDDIDTVEDTINDTEIAVEQGNIELIQATNSKDTGTLLKGITGGILSGSAVGGITGFQFGGVGAIPGIIIGALGGSLVGLGSAKAVKDFVNKKTTDSIIKNMAIVDKHKEFIKLDKENNTGIVFFKFELPKNNETDINKEYNTDKYKDIRDTDRFKNINNNLGYGIKLLQETKDITNISHKQLILQGDSLNRSAKTVEVIQEELDNTGILITKLRSNSILYFIKLFFNNNGKSKYIDKLNNNIAEKLKSNPDKYILTETHRNTWFFPWNDICFENDILLLQKFWNNYRIVVVNPDDQEKVIVVYKFTAKRRQDAIDILGKIQLMFIKLFANIDNRCVYNVITFLPSIDELLHEKNSEDELNDKLDDMCDILANDIRPTAKAINNELERHNAIMTTMNKESIKTRTKIKRYNREVEKEL